MLHFWKSAKLCAQRLGLPGLLLLQACLCALGVLFGIAVPRKKKIQTSLMAGGMFAATCLPLLNKFLDASDELAAAEQDN